MQRQYTGTAGRVENCQVAVYLTYAAAGGHALIDRELYLPESWAADPGRCAAAGIPAGTGFAAKPELALRMITRALDAGMPAAWVTGDEVYGADPALRAGLEERQMSYVLAVAKSHPVTTVAGACRADALANRLPPRAWQRLAGPGAKGHRWYDWAWAAIDPGSPGTATAFRPTGGPVSWPITAATRPAKPPSPPWPGAGRRWTVEEDFQAARAWPPSTSTRSARWTSWYRWVTLAMLALAFLTVAALTEHAQPSPAGLIPLTRNEIARLAAAVINEPARDTRRRLRWSPWRRRHQHTARACHYRRQAADDP